MLVAQAGWLECAEKVIANGAVISHQSTSGSHALILASSSGHKNIVALLLRETENVDLPDNSGDTALIAAGRKDHQNVAQQLIASGASIHARNNHFESAKTLALAKSDRSWEDMFDQKTGFWGLVSGGR
jgi:ankyrin repeat protein